MATVSGATLYVDALPDGREVGRRQQHQRYLRNTSGNVTVTANNACGSSTARTLAVTANTTPARTGYDQWWRNPLQRKFGYLFRSCSFRRDHVYLDIAFRMDGNLDQQ